MCRKSLRGKYFYFFAAHPCCAMWLLECQGALFNGLEMEKINKQTHRIGECLRWRGIRVGGHPTNEPPKYRHKSQKLGRRKEQRQNRTHCWCCFCFCSCFCLWRWQRMSTLNQKWCIKQKQEQRSLGARVGAVGVHWWSLHGAKSIELKAQGLKAAKDDENEANV